jgi:beta-lactamase superfamily II metal-dependent hydrolase
MLALTMLPARQGDALWIRWGDEASPHQLIIDMGTEEIGTAIRERLQQLDESQREFELLVVTHVDRDHIGGILTCLAEAEPLAQLKFKDVWFNGWTHLNGGFVTQPEPDE